MKSVKQAQTKTPSVVGSVIWKQQGTTCKTMIYDTKEEEPIYKLVRGIPVSHFM